MVTFLRNHARGVIACDFLASVTSTFRVLYVLVVIEHHIRRFIHFNVTAHPAAQWTRQQVRTAVGYEKKEASGHKTDAMLDLYDHEVAVVEPAKAGEAEGVL